MKFLNSIDGANRLIEDANHRLVSDIEKMNWNSKANGAHNQAISTITNLQTELDKKILLDDTIQNTNPFGGRKLYINTLDNALSGADKKYYVTVTLHKKVVNSVNYPKPINIGDITLPQWEDSPIVSTLNASVLFNNSYESGISIPSDSYAKIRLDFNESGTSYFSGYPYGTYYLSYYHTQTPLNAQVRCYNGFASHYIGYKTLNFSNYINTNTSSNYIQHCPDYVNYQRREIEFIIIGHDAHPTHLTQIEWKLSRPNFATNTPIFSNYGVNKSYQIMYFGNQSSNNITLNPNGDISALTFSGTLSGNANTATKLATARTINGVSFDGSANITITANPNPHTHDERYYTKTQTDTQLNDKVNNSRVLTDVPVGAKFTDTIYTHPTTHPASMITGLPTTLPANGGNATSAKHLVGDDTRSSNYLPSDYMIGGIRFEGRAGLQTEFKIISTIGVGSFFTGTYCYLETKTPWTDPSGGYPIQIAYGNGSPCWRVGTGVSTWSEWKGLNSGGDAETLNGLRANDLNITVGTVQPTSGWWFKEI